MRKSAGVAPRKAGAELAFSRLAYSLVVKLVVQLLVQLLVPLVVPLVIQLVVQPAMAQSGAAPQVAGASLDELLDMEVTSVSKKDQALSETGAAVFVITQEDIRRSGANNIPDLLRMAPGVEVAQIDASNWAISIRGFNTIYANKVLVLIDGRTLYVDTFSGVYWDQVEVTPENIERIEVIRGPGGTVWGANAVNGVINIITKSAADTKGGLLTASSGTRTSAGGTLQYGGDWGSTGAFRVFGRYFNTDSSVFPNGQRATDGAHGEQGGFRGDWSLSGSDTLSVQAGFLATDAGDTSSTVLAGPPLQEALLDYPLTDTAGNVLARWEHTLAGGSTTSLQIYDNAMHRNQKGLDMTNNVVDVEFQHHLTLGPRHDMVWGLDYRLTDSLIVPFTGSTLTFQQPRRVDNLFAIFLQDEIRISHSVFLTVGSKFEHNDYTGFEYEPSIQAVWKINGRNTLWASASRAIRQPDRSENDLLFDQSLNSIPGYGTALVVIHGNPAVLAEQLLDFETGYRARLTAKLSLDLTTFLSFYHHLETVEPGAPYEMESGGYPLIVLPYTLASLAHARDFGGELFATWKVTGRWKLSPGYSLLHMHVERDPSSLDISSAATAADSPSHQMELRSLLNLPKNLEWDGSLKYVASLATQSIPGYARLDTRIGWRIGEHFELSLTGQNLTSPRHLEFADVNANVFHTEVLRSGFAKLTFRF